MPNHKFTHNENRKRICAPCGSKIIFYKKTSITNITISLESLIKKYINQNFNINNEMYPVSICVSCRLTLQEYEKNIFQRKLPQMPNYEVIKMHKVTRFMKNEICNCFICLNATLKSHKKINKGRGKVRKLCNKITNSTGMYAASKKKQLTQNNNYSSKPETNNVKTCKKCYQEVGKGKNHAKKCSGVKNVTSNLLNVIEKLPINQQEQITTCFLKRSIDNQSIHTNNFKNNNYKNVNMNLSTFNGLKLRVSIKPPKNEKNTFKEESLDNYYRSTGSSINQMKKLTNFLRCNIGKKSVPSNYIQHLSTKSENLKNVYKIAKNNFDIEGANKKEERVVIYADAEELLDAVLEERNQVYLRKKFNKIL